MPTYSTLFLSTQQGRDDAKWWVIDAAGAPIGRVATAVTKLIRGKHKATYTPSTDCGDFVVIVNADKVTLTGNKMENKLYRHHTGWAGGLKEIKGAVLLAKKPEEAITRAVRGMLADGILFHRILNKVKIYKGTEHPHSAQAPQTYKLTK